MNAPKPPAGFEPRLVLLLYGDRDDPVARTLLAGHARLGWPMVAVSTQELADGVELGDVWTVAGHRIEPARTALINRLPADNRLSGGQPTGAGTMTLQAVWTRLREEIGRFGYASSLPTASSMMGCHGSLLDQWQDLPRLVPGLRVPDHSAASLPRDLHGNVFAVDRWTPYSLGKPLAEALAGGLPTAVRLDYVLPEGALVHLAQVGDTMFFAPGSNRCRPVDARRDQGCGNKGAVPTDGFPWRTREGIDAKPSG